MTRLTLVRAGLFLLALVLLAVSLLHHGPQPHVQLAAFGFLNAPLNFLKTVASQGLKEVTGIDVTGGSKGSTTIINQAAAAAPPAPAKKPAGWLVPVGIGVAVLAVIGFIVALSRGGGRA